MKPESTFVRGVRCRTAGQRALGQAFARRSRPYRSVRVLGNQVVEALVAPE